MFEVAGRPLAASEIVKARALEPSGEANAAAAMIVMRVLDIPVSP
jgi:hypothetical protein